MERKAIDNPQTTAAPNGGTTSLLRRLASRWMLVCALALILFLLGIAGAVLWVRWRIQEPFGGAGTAAVSIEIARGSSVSSIAKTLQSHGVVSSAWLFKLHVRSQGLDSRLKAGEYRFEGPHSMVDVADKLYRGEVVLHRATLPEGLDLRAISRSLAEQGWGLEERFLELSSQPSLISDFDPKASNLEGYLFPETYFFPRRTSEAEIIAALVDRHRKLWTDARRLEAENLGMSIREIVTLASLVEKETALAQERPVVSSVFHNRLRQNISLDCDPTVIYAVKLIKEYDGVIHRSDLEIDSPYNTYRYRGLPPGPIAAPGLASIEAALRPADTDYLFFVSRNDGSHVFSRTSREHDRAVRKYQR